MARNSGYTVDGNPAWKLMETEGENSGSWLMFF